MKQGIRFGINITADSEDKAIEIAWEAMSIEMNLLLHDIHYQGALDEEAVLDGIESNTWYVEFSTNEHWQGKFVSIEVAPKSTG